MSEGDDLVAERLAKLSRMFAPEVKTIEQLTAERDHWIRSFNRLDAAINHHKRDVQAGGFADDPDERLWKARDKILRDCA